MKRGLVILDASETPAERFAARLGDFQECLKRAGCALGLIYGDVSRSGDIHYLTNFCLYWNEAVLAVPVEGEPALIMKLSKRVQPWIRRTTALEEITSGPDVAGNIARFMEQRLGTRHASVGLVDFSWWPVALLDKLRAALPDAELHDLSNPVRAARLVPDAEELALLRRTGASLDAAVENALAGEGTPNGRLALAVGESRKAGFMDADIQAGELSDGTRYLSAVGQYRYAWIRICRARGGAVARRLEEAMALVTARLRPGMTEETVARLLAERIGGADRYAFSCVPHTGLETGGLFRPPDDASRPLREGEVVSPMLVFAGEGEAVSLSETLRVTGEGGEILTGDQPGYFTSSPTAAAPEPAPGSSPGQALDSIQGRRRVNSVKHYHEEHEGHEGLP